MSKELVISAASHERRVAILEEGQLVEIYIEREKEFALVGSIYKGKVTRVLPGMQSAFVDIGLDGDAFLYVSDVFENLEDYDHGHPHEQPLASVASLPPANGSPVELLPGESLGRVSDHHEEVHHEEFQQDEAHHSDEQHASHDEAHAAEDQHLEEPHDAVPSAISAQKLERNASRIPMLPRLRTSRRVTIPRRTIPPAAVATVPARILAAAVTEAEIVAAIVVVIAAAVAVGDAVVDAIAADTRRRVAQAGAICLPQNMHRRKVASPADTRIAAHRSAVKTCRCARSCSQC